jgi:lysyl-tRNA synthetase class 2
LAAEDHIGPHEVEKQRRLEQLKKFKPLGEYHPRLSQPASAEKLTIREFNAKYAAIEGRRPDVVAVLGTNMTAYQPPRADRVRKNSFRAIIRQ